MKPNRRKFIKQILYGAGSLTAISRAGSNDGTGSDKVLGKHQGTKIIVDSHQHFWDPIALKLPPPSPEAAVLGRAFLPTDLRPEIAKLGITSTVLVQGYPQTEEANQWYFKQANATDYVRGVVAWVDLQNPAKVGTALERLRRESKFVGIRHIIQDEKDVNWMVRDVVLESFDELARQRVPFDMVIKPDHLRNVLKVLERVPKLSVVVDHIAKPNIASGGSPGWAEGMAEIARHPSVYCKLSGMVTEANWRHWKSSDLKPYITKAIEAFGWDRVMFGSDWPVCLLAADYQQVWLALQQCLGEISSEHRDNVFGRNAVRFYSLKVQGLTS